MLTEEFVVLTYHPMTHIKTSASLWLIAIAIDSDETRPKYHCRYPLHLLHMYAHYLSQLRSFRSCDVDLRKEQSPLKIISILPLTIIQYLLLKPII